MTGILTRNFEKGTIMASVLTVEMTKMVEKLNLKNMTPDIDITDMKLASPEINRPALQLSGYFAHFA